jgi:hypothetical protein
LNAQTFTAQDWVTIIAALAGLLVLPTITAIANLMVSVRNGQHLQKNTEITREIGAKTDVVNGHVNSESARREARLEALHKENQLLRDVLADKEKTAAVLAQSVVTASVSRSRSRSTDPAPQESLTKLASIDENTKATAENTARTDAAMQELTRSGGEK